jgi:hypothetical protein
MAEQEVKTMKCECESCKCGDKTCEKCVCECTCTGYECS